MQIEFTTMVHRKWDDNFEVNYDGFSCESFNEWEQQGQAYIDMFPNFIFRCMSGHVSASTWKRQLVVFPSGSWLSIKSPDLPLKNKTLHSESCVSRSSGHSASIQTHWYSAHWLRNSQRHIISTSCKQAAADLIFDKSAEALSSDSICYYSFCVWINWH